MNDQEKKDYLEHYKKAKEKGVPFFPDIIFKDTIAALLIFIVLVALAYFVGIPMESRANPNDTAYTPRPEWYFLFLFQLLKYFPGNLEVIGVMVIPGLFILLLILLPFLDKSPKRHFINRPYASLAAILVMAGIITLSILSVREAPPPQAAAAVDKAATLYVKNCSNCHGASISVPSGTDLHKLIALGGHTSMPAWGGDLSTDEIDALAGFITSQKGSGIYTVQCGKCHNVTVFASGNLQELQLVLEQGANYAAHKNQNVPDWNQVLSGEERNSLLNFLAAPDGQRLFEINCSSCHGIGVAFSGTESELRDLISKGGQHMTMPAWQGSLNKSDIETLASYVIDPAGVPAGKPLFDKHCATCHGAKVPSAPDRETALKMISSGGAHMTMPVWGKILTPEQLDALTKYTLVASTGKGLEAGAQLFTQNCAPCHGQFGQGGPVPGRAGDMITTISSADFLKTRDNITLRNIISLGLPDSGMTAFSSANGGPLSDDQVDAILTYIRSWEANPPPILPTATPAPVLPSPTPGNQTKTIETSFTTTVLPIFIAKCQMCHNSSTKLGGWEASSYSTILADAKSGPVIVPGDIAASPLALLIQGVNGKSMPPMGSLPQAEIQIILDWISSGANP
ncbi:MAG: c-type cytochrome [Chloroflexi bacterium]|nr:c-type cytochrome [Chloroflexota bacterium]